MPVHVQLQAGRKALAEMVKRFRWLLWAAFLSLPLLFGWLTFQGVDFVKVGRQLEVELLLKLSLALYFLSWSVGVGWETNDIESYYALPPNRGRLPRGAFAAIVFLLAVFAVLCFVDSFKWFAMALGLLWALNLLGWLYLRLVMRPALADSLDLYEKSKKYDRLESLLVFNELNQGPWHYWRFVAGFLLVAFLNLMAFSPLSETLGDQAGGIPGDVVLALSVLCFILVVEGWIWFKRIRARNGFRLIASLAEKYELCPKTPLALVPSTSQPVSVPATPVSV